LPDAEVLCLHTRETQNQRDVKQCKQARRFQRHGAVRIVDMFLASTVPSWNIDVQIKIRLVIPNEAHSDISNESAFPLPPNSNLVRDINCTSSRTSDVKT
jgi:hypothetical protein